MLSFHRCDYYKCQNNCTIADETTEGYYMLHLEMTDLDLHPGDHKLLLEDDDYAMYDDSEFEDETNMTYFDNIRYFFLVSA